MRYFGRGKKTVPKHMYFGIKKKKELTERPEMTNTMYSLLQKHAHFTNEILEFEMTREKKNWYIKVDGNVEVHLLLVHLVRHFANIC